MSQLVSLSCFILLLSGATGASAQIAESTDEFRRKMACERFVDLLQYEVEWFAGVERDEATFDPANRPAMCAFLQTHPAPNRDALCAGPPPDDFWPDFLTYDQVSFLIQISIAKTNLDFVANGLPPGASVDLDYLRTECSPATQWEALRLMQRINALQHPDCLDPCGNAITLPGISHSADSCPDL